MKHGPAFLMLVTALHGYAVGQPADTSSGGASTTLAVVKTARLRLMDATKQVKLLAGRLYRISLTGDQAHIADVDENGALDQPYECAKGDRLLGAPSGMVTGSNRSKPCKDAIEFEYQRTYSVQLEPSTTGQDVSFGSYLKAYSDYGSIYATAAGNTTGAQKIEFLKKARASETAVTAATALTLGDKKLDRLVSRDPSQGYRLVLSDEGVLELRKLQRENNIPVTGQIDSATLNVLGNKDVPEALKTSNGNYLGLPNNWLHDDVVKKSLRKSPSLQELKAAMPK